MRGVGVMVFASWCVLCCVDCRTRTMIRRLASSRLHCALMTVHSCGCLHLHRRWRAGWQPLAGCVSKSGLTTSASASLLLT